MDKVSILGFTFLAITFVGFYFAYLYGRKTKNFRWKEYFAIIIWPLFAVLGLAYFIDIRILPLFLISSFAGSFLEYIVGLTYHKTLNKKLWVYKRLSIGEYTSVLTIPIWGMAGVIFWFISAMIGL